MKRLLFLFFSFLSACASAQQFPFEFWHEGKLVLETSDTLRGLIKYDLASDLIQVKVKNKLESFTARKVLFFEIFDATVKRYRQFYSLPYSQNNTYNAPTFFELLSEGKITLLAREKLEYRAANSYYYYNNYSRPVLVNSYYLLKPNGTIEPFSAKKSDFLELMKDKADEAKEYAKENRLDFDDKYELTRIIDYYNSLFQKK